MQSRLRISPVWWIALFFFLSGLAFIRKAGLHFDASYEIAGFYRCCTSTFKAVVFGHPLPVMVLPYLGAFKAWLYFPLLRYLEVTPFVLRVPSLLTGTASVGLFFALLDRTIGRPGAVAGALILATDAVFLIATTYDFGPVAFLHCFLLAGILVILDFEHTRRYKSLALAFFLFGLALWHKALFIWMLDGLIVAAMVVFPRRILSLVTPVRLFVAAVAICAGAMPLICFNVVTRGATLHTNDVMSGSAPISQKLLMLRKTMSGNVFFGWLTEESHPGTNACPKKLAARVLVGISALLHGQVRSNGMFYGFLVGCGMVPWLWFTRLRPITMFVVVYLLVTWLQMAALTNTGASAHHVLLLWPFPHFLIAIAVTNIASAIGRQGVRIRACVLMVMVGSNLLLIFQYYADLTTNGTTAIWTDAVYPLFNYLDSLKGAHIIVTDWGYSTTLCVLSDGQMSFDDISYILLGPSPAELAWIRSLMDDPQNVFVQHAAGSEQFAAAAERLASLVTPANRARDVLAVISDRNQRPRFEIVRYTR